MRERILYTSIAGLIGCAIGYGVGYFLGEGVGSYYLMVPVGVTFAVFGFLAKSDWGSEIIRWIFEMLLNR